jgi:hypothetical protein
MNISPITVHPNSSNDMNKLISFLQRENIPYNISAQDNILSSIRNSILDIKKQYNISFSGVGIEGDCIAMNMSKEIDYHHSFPLYEIFSSGTRLYIALHHEYDSHRDDILKMLLII